MSLRHRGALGPIHFAASCCLLVITLAWAPVRAAPQPGSTQRFQALLAQEWAWNMAEFPEFASAMGEHAHGDRWADMSPAARARRDAHAQALLATLQRWDRRTLQGEDQLSYDVLRYDAEMTVAGQRFTGLHLRSLSPLGGVHLSLQGVLETMPVRTEAQVRQVLGRLASYPARVDQEVVGLREAARLGWVTHQAALAQVPDQIDRLLSLPLNEHPALEPLRRMQSGEGQALPPARREVLVKEAEQLLVDKVFPSWRSLRRVVTEELLPKAPGQGGLASLPDGAAAYAHEVRRQTTTEMTPQALHELGLREVARLKARMEAIPAEMGYSGNFEAWVTELNTHPRYFYSRPEDLLSGYRDIAKRVDPLLPSLFMELPRMPYGIRAIPPSQGPGVPENYSGGAPDGSRAGWFNANVVALKERPIWEMEALFLHEAVPGHHLQTARALELKGLPMFRRAAWWDAYGEGWALYAEGLGEALGLYREPTSRYGQLRMEIWRAARLVVDTGLHALGWSREQAIDWMVDNTRIDRASVTAEVDRYLIWPGQALAYKVGQLKLLSLRDQARQALGERFDLRAFHQEVLDHGPLPLSVLERRIQAWAADQGPGLRRRVPPPPARDGSR